jgi:hypothetical protein
MPGSVRSGKGESRTSVPFDMGAESNILLTTSVIPTRPHELVTRTFVQTVRHKRGFVCSNTCRGVLSEHGRTVKTCSGSSKSKKS